MKKREVLLLIKKNLLVKSNLYCIRIRTIRKIHINIDLREKSNSLIERNRRVKRDKYQLVIKSMLNRVIRDLYRINKKFIQFRENEN